MATVDAVSEFVAIFRQPAFCRTWPQPDEQLDWHRALIMAGHTETAMNLDGCAKTAQAGRELIGYPIVGVLGQLNAGKSSVVASFLSATGQARLPRGLYDDQGTHRFVYWLPESWRRDASVWDAFQGLLSSVHGSQIEYLKDDPAQAAEQYGSGLGKPDLLCCPLVAFDSALNEQGFALLDCPDVQTRDTGVPQLRPSNNPRVQFVSNAARLCSSFLYVWEASKLRESLFGDLLHVIRGASPNVRISILVNKIKPFADEPARTLTSRSLTDAVSALGISSTDIYGAFDHDVAARADSKGNQQPGWDDLTPPALVRRFRDTGSSHPQFFAISPELMKYEPTSVEENRFLHVVLKSLPPAELQRSHFNAMLLRLASDSRRAVSHLREFISTRASHARDTQAHLLETAVSVFTEPGSGKAKQAPTPEYLMALQSSVVRTAPLAIRIALNLSQATVDITKSTVSKICSVIAFPISKIGAAIAFPISQIGKVIPFSVRGGLRLASDALEKAEMFKVLTNGLMVGYHSSRDLARMMMVKQWFPSELDESVVIMAIDDVHQAISTNPIVPPPPEIIDADMRKLWEHVTHLQAIKLFVVALLNVTGSLIAIGGVACVLVDGGATLFGTVSIAKLLSAKLGLLGLLGGGSLAWLANFEDSLTQFNTVPALSRYFAMLCDVFGVPRPDDFTVLSATFDGTNSRAPDRLVDPAVAALPVRCSLGDQSQWREEIAVAQLERWAATNE